MNLYTRKHHAPGIPLVPMLDILTILLIFFIVHTEFKQQVNVLKLEIPRTEHLSGEKGERDRVLLEVGEDGSLALAGKLVEPSQLTAAVQAVLASHPEARVQVSAAGGAAMARFIEVLDKLTAAGLPVEEVPIRIDYKGN